HLDARLCGPTRVAVWIQRPARHQGGVAQAERAQVALDLDAAPEDQQAVDGEAAVRPASNLEAVRLPDLPIDQAERGPIALPGAQLQRVAAAQPDPDRQHIGAAVDDLDHCVAGLVEARRLLALLLAPGLGPRPQRGAELIDAGDARDLDLFAGIRIDIF